MNNTPNPELLTVATEWHGSEPVACYMPNEDTLVTVHQGALTGQWALLSTFFVGGTPLVSQDFVSRDPADLFEPLARRLSA